MTGAEERIGAFGKFGWKLGLERMRILCGLLGEPQARLNVIHVAGTNGKGSVCRYLYEILLAHHYTVGLFMSPGLGDFRSRIESDGSWITGDDLEHCTDLVMAAVDQMADGDAGPPTEFEVLTAVAFVYFASKELDFVILEVGLGGVADSTNIVDSPIVSVITEISFDHIDHLGDTIERIAGEKAGIIKSGRPVVTSAADEAAKVIAQRAYALGAPLTLARMEASVGSLPSGKGIRTRIIREDLGGTAFSCEMHGARYDNIEISMPGRHQVENAVCALAAFDALRRMKGVAGLPARSDAAALRAGMKAACLPGRFQVVSSGDADSPVVILDGAHNPAGAAALHATVSALLPGMRILALISVARDKQVDVILRKVQEFAEGAIFTESSNVRSMGAMDLAHVWSSASPSKAVEAVISDPRGAYAAATSLISVGESVDNALISHIANPIRVDHSAAPRSYDALVVCGSLYLVSDIMIDGMKDAQRQEEIL